MSSPELSIFQASVVSACSEIVKTSLSNTLVRRCLTWDTYFIKFGNKILYSVAATQHYIYQQAFQDENAPRVPKVIDCFSYGGMTYLVMEAISATIVQAFMDTDSSKEWVYSGVAKALNWLRSLPAPPEARIGPVGHGFARHKVFKDWVAPLQFSSTRALEIYINQVWSTLLYNSISLSP